jgi:NAD-dependent dihydropyrimidine dehydrogenase PreA subunit
LTGNFDPDISKIKEIKPNDGPNEIECIPPEACKARAQCVDACDNRAIKFKEIL